MTKQFRWKIFVDVCITCGMLVAMSYLLIGEEAHEWIGTALLIFFVVHHILNFKWYQNLFQGRYSTIRIVQTVLNFLLLVTVIGLAVSSVILSRYVFDFLPIRGLSSFGRTLHMVSAYWGFVLMSAHLGLHWGMVLGMLKKAGGEKHKNRFLIWGFRLIGFIIAAYGLTAFLRYDLLSYMFLRKQFVFFDVNQPLFLFLLDYMAIMGAFIWLFHTIKQILIKISLKRKK